MQFFHIQNYTTVRNSIQLKTAAFWRRLKIPFLKIFTTSRLCELVWSSDNHKTLLLWRCSLRYSHFFEFLNKWPWIPDLEEFVEQEWVFKDPLYRFNQQGPQIKHHSLLSQSIQHSVDVHHYCFTLLILK